MTEEQQQTETKKKRREQQPSRSKEAQETKKEKLPEEKEFEKLITILDDLKKQGKFLAVQICPQCKSARLRRVGSMSGDMSGQMDMTNPKFECLDCGWRGRIAIYATNQPIDKKQMEVVADFTDLEKEKEEYR
ncbi:MAG TPA: hypothetical protein VFF30_02835 [Nitrososphaerales archaeon]|nr:hypothetical protein [Nitrososphaerales archaeon]